MKRALTLAAVAALAVTPLAAVAQADAHPQHDQHPSGGPTIVATGLNNPRQLAFSHDGDLYVAEAGAGGSGPCNTGPEGGTVCFGLTGSVTKISHGHQRRVVTGLPSIGGQGDGAQALGPADVAPTRHHSFVLSLGLGADPAVRDTLPSSGKILGTLQWVSLRGHHGHRGHHGDDGDHGARLHTIADLAAHEAATNPIDNPDSDPTGVVLTRHGIAATDSGGNTLVEASWWGHVSTLAAFPDVSVEFPPGSGQQVPMQAVPTDVVRGPDGALYVSQLTGFPFPQGAANIYRVVPGQQPTVYASGLTNVTSLAFSRDGSLYAVEIASTGLLNGPTGDLVKVAPNGSGQTTQVVAGDLFAPYGVAIRHGSAYVTTGSVAAGAGQVMRIPLS
jgi:hypothetical protein